MIQVSSKYVYVGTAICPMPAGVYQFPPAKEKSELDPGKMFTLNAKLNSSVQVCTVLHYTVLLLCFTAVP